MEKRILERLKERNENSVDHKQILAEISEDEDEDDSEEEAERARREREERRKRILGKHKKSKPQKKVNSHDKNQKDEDSTEKIKSNDENDTIDIFSLATMKAPVKDIVAATKTKKAEVTLNSDVVDENSTLADNWDDAEGYYRTRIGDMLGGRYRVAKYSGQGVFSTVLICTDERDEKKTEVAIKIIRANETMRKASEKELHILKTLAKHDHPGRRFNIELLEQFFHRNHTCLVFEPLSMNLRMLLKKLATGVGISIVAVQRFATQIFLALRQLRVLNIVRRIVSREKIAQKHTAFSHNKNRHIE